MENPTGAKLGVSHAFSSSTHPVMPQGKTCWCPAFWNVKFASSCVAFWSTFRPWRGGVNSSSWTFTDQYEYEAVTLIHSHLNLLDQKGQLMPRTLVTIYRLILYWSVGHKQSYKLKENTNYLNYKHLTSTVVLFMIFKQNRLQLCFFFLFFLFPPFFSPSRYDNKIWMKISC